MELLFFFRRAVTSDCRKNLNDCKQDVLPQQTSIQPSLTFCQRSVTRIDEDHTFFFSRPLLSQAADINGREGQAGGERRAQISN